MQIAKKDDREPCKSVSLTCAGLKRNLVACQKGRLLPPASLLIRHWITTASCDDCESQCVVLDIIAIHVLQK